MEVNKAEDTVRSIETCSKEENRKYVCTIAQL